jgi:VIT1/CCC1 family predicted Fe2+/Mn2+ transporter
VFQRKGIAPELAQRLAHEVMSDPDLALETHAREELGISTRTLGSPWQAAAASFVTFAVGAFIPLLPWLIGSGTAAIVASVVLGAVAAVIVGVVLARFTERPVIPSALRQLAVTAIAAGVTYAVGRAIGTGLS